MRKHLLYLTNTALTARMWQSGRLSPAITFQNDADGWQGLAAHLSGFAQVPVFLLIDLIEEDFQRDTMPHVFGKTRKNLIERRLLQLYRDTPFRHASHQGREKTGRKDDVMLFSGMTNAALITPWIDAILKQQVPIAGIFSASLFSSVLFNQFKPGNEPVLLITHQSAGLRQNFFHNGYLRFSRLIQLPSEDPAAIAELSGLELTKTRLFLANARLLQRGEALRIIALDNPQTLLAMQQHTAEADAAAYRYITLSDAARQFGLKHLPESAVADALLLALLGRKTPASHFALQEQTNAYTLWQVRIVLYLFSVATLAGCLLWSGANALDALETTNRLRDQEKLTAINQQRYQEVIASMPKTLADPKDMKASVNVHNLLLQNSSRPTEVMNLIGTALDHLPRLRLDELNWEVGDGKDPAAQTAGQTAGQSITTLDATLIGLPARPPETVTLKGVVVPFEHDYRSALDSVNELITELRKNQNIQVSAVLMPLDISPGVALKGEAGHDSKTLTPGFELHITWKP